MIDREIRDTRNKAIEDAVASMDNRMRHLFNQGFELGKVAAKKEIEKYENKTKTGKWIKQPNPNYSNFDGTDGYIYTCDRCSAKYLHSWNYCPDCGSDMRKEQ